MKIDISESLNQVQAYILERFNKYNNVDEDDPASSNNTEYEVYERGPGDRDDPVSQITLGFEFGEDPWVALIFDTREDAHPDGEWNLFIEPNRSNMPQWEHTFAEEWSQTDVAEYLGEQLKRVLCEACKSEAFKHIPLADNFHLTVEHHDGFYGWTDYPVDGQTDEEYLELLDHGAENLSHEDQVDYWIKVLNRVASGEEQRYFEWAFLAQEHAIEQLEDIGELAVVPMLKFVLDWSDKPEYTGDYPDEELEDMPMSSVVCAVLSCITELGDSSGETEGLLQEILQKSIVANEGRELWGVIPVWAARCLEELFEYPEPQQDENSNKLLNINDYL